jgi:anti-sigma factor (TIGR02949 family)
MMKCPEAQRHLDPFMDGELSVVENLKVLEHLNLCAACARVYEGEKALRASLREKLGREKAPAGLAERLSGALDAGSRPSLRGWRWLAAAGLLVALGASFLLLPHGPIPQAMAEEIASRHEAARGAPRCANDADRRCLCANCAADPRAATEKFFEEKGRPDHCRHPFEQKGYATEGVSTWSHRGKLVCWSVQRDAKGRAMSHALYPEDLLKMGKPAEVKAPKGRVMLFVARGDMT